MRSACRLRKSLWTKSVVSFPIFLVAVVCLFSWPKGGYSRTRPIAEQVHCHLVLYDSLGKIVIFKQKESKKVLVKRMEHLFNVTHHSDVILTKAD